MSFLAVTDPSEARQQQAGKAWSVFQLAGQFETPLHFLFVASADQFRTTHEFWSQVETLKNQILEALIFSEVSQ